MLEQSRVDRERLQADVPPLEGELTLEEALARALKFNLDRRAKMMEEALAFNQLDVARLDLLPRLAYQAGYSTRNNDRITAVRTTLNPTGSDGFISTERSHQTEELGLTWGVVDLSLGYFNSQQQANRVLIAMERRRKATHILLQDVRTAFWKAASAQKLQTQIRKVTQDAEKALLDARKAEVDRIRGPLDSLRYQRQILENLRLLEAIEQELATAQVELAALINLPAGKNYRIVEPTSRPDLKALDIPIESLEEMALASNPDLKEQSYSQRIAAIETRKVMARLFPNLVINYTPKYDSDRYQINRSWNETGIQLSFNIFNLFTADTQRRLADAGVAVADQRRMVVQMAVLTQVHLARQQFANAVSQFNRAEDIWNTDSRIADLINRREQARVQSKLDVVSNDTSALLSLLRRFQAVSAVFAAEARLNATLGVEVPVGDLSSLDLVQLGKVIGRAEQISANHQLSLKRQAAEAAVAEAKQKSEIAARAAQMAESNLSATSSLVKSLLASKDALLRPLEETVSKTRAAHIALHKAQVEETERLAVHEKDLLQKEKTVAEHRVRFEDSIRNVEKLTLLRYQSVDSHEELKKSLEASMQMARASLLDAKTILDSAKAGLAEARRELKSSRSAHEQAVHQLRLAQRQASESAERRSRGEATAEPSETNPALDETATRELTALLGAAVLRLEQDQQAEARALSELTSAERSFEAAKAAVGDTDRQAAGERRSSEDRLLQLARELSDLQLESSRRKREWERHVAHRDAAAKELADTRTRLGSQKSQAQQRLDKATQLSESAYIQFEKIETEIRDAQSREIQESATVLSKAGAAKDAERAVLRAEENLELVPKTLDEYHVSKERKN